MFVQQFLIKLFNISASKAYFSSNEFPEHIAQSDYKHNQIINIRTLLDKPVKFHVLDIFFN